MQVQSDVRAEIGPKHRARASGLLYSHGGISAVHWDDRACNVERRVGRQEYDGALQVSVIGPSAKASAGVVGFEVGLRLLHAVAARRDAVAADGSLPAVIAGEKVAVSEVKAWGCSIKRVKKSAGGSQAK